MRSKRSDPALPPYTGWLVGILCGVLIGLWALPPVRYTLGSQLQFALASGDALWTHALDTRRAPGDRARLDEAAAVAPEDYLLQVGRATALAETGGLRPLPAAHLPLLNTNDDRTLIRLALLATRFPNSPGAYAHLARYLMVDRVRVLRAELSSRSSHKATATSKQANSPEPIVRTIPATHHDVRLMEWALQRGARLDPDNTFWPAMLATTYFAAGRDREGLQQLSLIRQTNHWEAYLYEEVLGQWRLYSQAYGDHGAAQKVGPLSLIAFPHLNEIRRMAELARWHAEQAARAGHDREALHIRHDLARLGQIMRETTAWAYEALYGTEILLIASTDSDSKPTPLAIHNVNAWRPLAKQYLDLLQRNGRTNEIAWVTQQVQQSCQLRQAVDLARSDASFPGIPPGIPLAPLFGHWMMGICLIQQTLALIAAALAALFWKRWGRTYPRRLRGLFLAALWVAAGISGALLFFGVPSVRLAVVFLVSITLLLLNGARQLGHLRNTLMDRPPVMLGDALRMAEQRWSYRTTLRLLALALLPCLLMLPLLESIVGRMHPVAVLLTTLFGAAQRPSAWEMLRSALLSGALPLALALAAGVWGLARGVTPLPAAVVGLRRTALPMITCLTLIYLVLMQRTLRLDAEASRAINEAAKNDLQWVLTHTDVSEDNS